MKKLVIALVLSINALFALTQAEIEAAQAQAQALINQANQKPNAPMPTNQGESIFQGKAGRDSTIHDWSKSSVRIDPISKEVNSYQNAQYQNYSQVATNINELDENQLALLKSAMRNKNLRAVQQKFLRKNYKGTENTKRLNYQAHTTQKITTRFAMATTLIFKQPIDSYIVGDSTGFQVEELPNMKNALAIKPLLIGIDTSLTVFTKDKKLHTFFIYSTDYKSIKDPDLVVYINEEEAPQGVIIYDEKQERLAKDYLHIKEGISEVWVKKSEIYDEYVQKALEKNEWLMAEEIFNDKQFTYFKYDKDKLPQIPAVFVVTDEQDSPIESRVIGNYLIIETTAPKFTLRIGESYVCVEKIDEKNMKKYYNDKELAQKSTKNQSKKAKIIKAAQTTKIKPKTKTKIIDEVFEVDRFDEFGNEKGEIQLFHERHNKGKSINFNEWFKNSKTITKTKKGKQ